MNPVHFPAVDARDYCLDAWTVYFHPNINGHLEALVLSRRYADRPSAWNWPDTFIRLLGYSLACSSAIISISKVWFWLVSFQGTLTARAIASRWSTGNGLLTVSLSYPPPSK